MLGSFRNVIDWAQEASFYSLVYEGFALQMDVEIFK
jgi:hypothetical protein